MVADSWFSDAWLFKPLSDSAFEFYLLSWLRSKYHAACLTKPRWVVLFTTELTLSVQQIIEQDGAGWKIESGFKKIRQEIGNVNRQTPKTHRLACTTFSEKAWYYSCQGRLRRDRVRRHQSKFQCPPSRRCQTIRQCIACPCAFRC